MKASMKVASSCSGDLGIVFGIHTFVIIAPINAVVPSKINTKLLPYVSTSDATTSTPTTAPSLPHAADMPCIVPFTCVAKISEGNKKVVEFGPKPEKKNAMAYTRMKIETFASSH